ncbi:MAG: hypothetical protein U0359_23530 [Byssovorax sp.]
MRPAERDDADFLAPRLRPADRREISAALGMEPRMVLRRGVQASNPCYAVVEGTIVFALFGVVPYARDPEIGSVWLLASERLAAHPAFVVRSSKVWIGRLHEHYRVLTNYVDARNEVHLRWLRFCGFTFVRRIERFGALGLPFYEVVHVREPAARPGNEENEERIHLRRREIGDAGAGAP